VGLEILRGIKCLSRKGRKPELCGNSKDMPAAKRKTEWIKQTAGYQGDNL